jgi:CBS domain-containing protein
MTVYACCRTDVVTVGPETSLRAVAGLMEEENVGSVVVVEEEKPVGIVTDRDLALRAFVNKMDLDATHVREIMSPDPVVLEAGMGLFEAMEFMRGRGVRRMPVVEENGMLRGIITVDDIIRLIVEELSCIANILEEESREASL